MINQVSIFAANEKGAMNKMTAVMQENDVNILALVTNDSAEFGIVRMLVDKPEKAYEALIAKGYLCRLTPVVGVEITDDCGGLNRLLDDITSANINVDYLYISYNRDKRDVTAVLHTNSESEIEECLECKGWTVL